MRPSLLVILSSLLLVSPAFAAQKFVKLSTSPSVSELRSACSKVGGSFDIAADGGGYGCIKENCDGKGGDCGVACDNNNSCTGVTPARLVGPMTLIGLLQNGDLVLRAPGTGGGSLADPRLLRPRPPAEPVEPANTDGTLY